MDNNNIDFGESSCRKKTNNDKMSEGERPLKKAKYPWQIKGKCHLKDSNSDNKQENNMESSPDEAKENVNTIIPPEIPSTTNNLEILGDYLLKQDFNIPPGDSTDSDGNSNKSDMDEDDDNMMDVLSSSESSAVTNNKNTSSGLSCTYISDASSSNNDTHPSLVEEKTTSLDTYIARWQARQIAKGFVDNTINRVLDSWLVAPLPQTYDDTHNLALDVAEFFDNLPANNTVENEGILMAISAHGLQNNQSSYDFSQRMPHRNYGSHLTIAMSECVSRNESNENQEPSERDSIENINNECLSDIDNKINQDISDVCQPFPATSTSNSSNNNNIKLDHRKSHSENELNSSFIENSSTNNTNNILDDSSWRPIPQPCNCSHTARRVNITPNIPFHKRDTHSYSNTNHFPSNNYSQTIPSHHHSPECRSNDDEEAINNIAEESIPPIIDVPFPEALQSVSDNQEFDDHFDFMDAAVSFAIQNKGLTSFSSVDYG